MSTSNYRGAFVSAHSDFKETNPREAIAALAALPAGSIVLLAGSVDTGKTTFAAEAARHLGANGLIVAVIDADTGQSEIGPPTTVGLGCIHPQEGASVKRLSDIALQEASFVGATSPSGHLLEWLAAVLEMLRRASAARADLLLVDLPGYVSGPAAVALFCSLVRSADPAMILAFARGAELDELLGAFRGRVAPPVIARITPSSEVGRKSPAVRSAHRAARFAHHFAGAFRHVLGWERVVLLGAQLAAGSPLAPNLLVFISNTLGTECLYAEKGSTGAILIVVDEDRGTSGVAALEEYFRTQRITIVGRQAYEQVLCGLLDEHGRYLDIGILDEVNFAGRTLTLTTPLRHPAAVRQVALGWLRLSPDGREVGAVRAVAR
jgi:polynucleotide 5'-hydroxyl-kinase GRC3/NOL9